MFVVLRSEGGHGHVDDVVLSVLGPGDSKEFLDTGAAAWTGEAGGVKVTCLSFHETREQADEARNLAVAAEKSSTK